MKRSPVCSLALVLTTGPVTFACDGTIVLSNPIVVTKGISLAADGHDVRLSGGGKVRLFEVSSNGSVHLEDLTLSEGFTQGADGSPAEEGRGGAVLVEQGELHAAGCRFEGNTAVGGGGTNVTRGGAARGGALFIAQGLLRLTNCSFVLNTLRGGSGGNTPDFPTQDNRGGEAGGGAGASLDSEVTAVGCQFAGNRAESGVGGTIGLPLFHGASPGLARGGAWQQTGGTCRFIGGSFRTNIAAAPPSRGSGSNAFGGAFSLQAGSAVLEDILFEENQALGGASSLKLPAGFGGGGALFNQGNAQLSRCTLRGNAASGGSLGFDGQDAAGGAIQNLGELLLVDCLVESNSTTGGQSSGGLGSHHAGAALGGGLWNGGTATLLSSTFHANRAFALDYTGSLGTFGWHAFGGGIFNTGLLTGANLTVAGNVAHGSVFPQYPGQPFGDPGGNAFGGGLFQGGGAISLTNATVADNEALGGGGFPAGTGLGDNLNVSNGVMQLRNCIVAGTLDRTNCVGAITDGGHNISSDSSCHFSAPGSLNDTDPKLAPFADYGGPTPTIALLPGSPALDTADAAACPPTDQRGHSRPFGPGCDIGAFESSPPYTVFGRITGFLGAAPDIQVSAGSVSTVPGPGGDYILHGFATGTYTVRPGSPAGVFLQSNSVVNLGPDCAVNFHCYRSNALTIELSAAGGRRVVFAGEAGRTYRLIGSSNPPNWLPLQTNGMSASELFDYQEADPGFPAQRLYKVLSP